MQIFKAQVQYGDWQGTAAADNSDHLRLSEYLRNKGVINDGQFLVAATMFVGEIHKGQIVRPPFIRAFIYDGGGTYELVRSALDTMEDPIPVREVKIEMELEEFLALFKRFDVMLTWSDLPLQGREYQVTN